jgi:hypothetical protein
VALATGGAANDLAARCPMPRSSAGCARRSAAREEMVAPTCWLTERTTWRGSEALLAALPDRRPRVLLLSWCGQAGGQMLALADRRVRIVWCSHRSHNPRAHDS